MEKISILVTTLNRDSFLAEALASVRSQTFTNWETIVVDNGQGTGAEKVIREIDDPRILYIKANRNLGECGGRNLAFRCASGDFFCYLDDDDLLTSDSLAARLDFYNNHPECGMIYAGYHVVQFDGHAWISFPEPKKGLAHFRKSYYDRILLRLEYQPQATYYLLKMFNYVRGGTPLIKRSTLEAVGLFEEGLPVFGDYEMWLRIAARYPIRFLDRTVYTYRLHPDSTSVRLARSEQAKESALFLCRRYGIRRSIQFHEFQADIDRLWAGMCVSTLDMPPI